MKLGLLTTKLGVHSTHGILFINGKFFGYTIEDVYRLPFFKLANQTAIPGGLYSCDFTFSQKFRRTMILVKNVDGFNGIRIHEGNTANDSSGCILVGYNKDNYGIGNSKVAINDLENIVCEAIKRGENIELYVARDLASIQKYSGFFPISSEIWFNYVW
jgi:hypothetical protein